MNTFHNKLSDYKIIILNPDNLDKYLKYINPHFSKIKQLAHKADYIRMLILYHYGGFWFDYDTIILQDIDSWNDKLKEVDLVWFGMGAFGCNKNNKFVKSVLDKIEVKINNSKNYVFSWREIGQDIIDPALENYKKNNKTKYYILPRTEVFFIPFYEDNSKKGFVSKNIDLYKKLKPSHKIVILHNQIYPSWFKKMDTKEILESDMIISLILKKY